MCMAEMLHKYHGGFQKLIYCNDFHPIDVKEKTEWKHTYASNLLFIISYGCTSRSIYKYLHLLTSDFLLNYGVFLNIESERVKLINL